MTHDSTVPIGEVRRKGQRHESPDLSRVDFGVLVLSLLLIVSFFPPLLFDSWSPRVALVVATLPIGVTIALLLARSRDLAASVLLAAVGWTIIAAIASPAPRSALLGFAGRDLSALVVGGVGALWALARQTSTVARRWLPTVIVASIAASAGIGLLQVVAGVQAGPLALASGRPTAFQANPVYFGAMCAVGLVIATERFASGTWWPWATAVVASGIGVSLSGSRVALAASVVVVLALMAARRHRVSAAAACVAGLSLAAGVGLDKWLGAGRNAADRLTEGATNGRLEVWRYGLQAALDRPLFGYGFGRFRPAVQRRFSAEFVRAEAVNDVNQAWFDAHNIFIGLLVAIGFVGVCLYVTFVVVCVRTVSGPLAWGLLPIAAHWLLQPVSLFTLPLAAIMLGAAMPAVMAPAPSSGAKARLRGGSDEGDVELTVSVALLPRVLTMRVLALVGLLLGGLILAADGLLSRAADANDAGAAAVIGDLYLGDPVVSNIVAQVYAADSSVPEPLTEVIRWRERSTRTEPDRPYWWTQLAEAQIAAQQYGEAQASIDRALELQTTNVSAWLMQGLLSVRIDDRGQLIEALDRLCELGQPQCELDVDELLADNGG